MQIDISRVSFAKSNSHQMQIDISSVSFHQNYFPPNANWHLKSIISPNLIPTKCKLTSQEYHFAKTNSHQMQIDISRLSFRQN